MLIYPTIKEAPIAGISGMGGGAAGLTVVGAAGYPPLSDGNPWYGAWTGYAGSAWGNGSWSGLSNSSNYGGDGGSQGKSSASENFGSSVSFSGTANCSGTFNACHRGANGWAIKANTGDMYIQLDSVHGSLGSIKVSANTTQNTDNAEYTFNNPSAGDIIGPGQVFWFSFSSGHPGQSGLKTIVDPS